MTNIRTEKAWHYQELINWKNNPKEVCEACLLTLWLIVDCDEPMNHALKVSCNKWAAKPGAVGKMARSILPKGYLQKKAIARMKPKVKEAIRQTKIAEHAAKKFQTDENPRKPITIEKVEIMKEESVTQQDELMKVDPRDGSEQPYPSNAKQFREYHGEDAWLYNPWTTNKRDTRDIGTDVLGVAITN